MNLKLIRLLPLLLLLIPAVWWGLWHVNAVPLPRPTSSVPLVSDSLPSANQKLLAYIQAHGSQLAPSYNEVVCTEFVIKVLEHLRPLSRQEKRDIRIITDDDLATLYRRRDPIMKGVQTALVKSHHGVAIHRPDQVLPGDLVQFWDMWGSTPFGHCGVVVSVSPGKHLTLYSSHPVTQGFGLHTFSWPSQVYFVRPQ